MPTQSKVEKSNRSIEPLLVDVYGLGRILACIKRHIWRQVSAGKIPQPITIGTKLKRWSVAEIREWIEAGSPDRIRWEEIKKGRGRSNAA